MKGLGFSIVVAVSLAASAFAGLYNRVDVVASPGIISVGVTEYRPAIDYTITYPPDASTTLQKAIACYSLLEQMRLEHNRQGEIARNNWGKYEIKWQIYSRLFKEKQLALLNEFSQLRLALRRLVYSDAQWKRLSFEQQNNIVIFDKEQYLQTATTAQYDGLTQLRAVNLDALTGTWRDPTEDFTTFTEVDSSPGRITIDANTVSWEALDREANWRVYKDYGVDYFAGDYEHWFDTCAVAYAGSGTQYQIFWALNNQTAGGNTAPCNLAYTTNTATAINWRIYDGDTATYDTYAGGNTYGTSRYWIANRTGTTFTGYVYADSPRTSLTDTLTVGSITATSYRYCYAMSSLGGTGVYDLDGWIENLDLREEAAEPDISVSSPAYNFGTTYASTNYTSSNFTMTNGSTMSTNVSCQVLTSTWNAASGNWTHSDTATAGVDTAGLVTDNNTGTWTIIKYNSPYNDVIADMPASTNWNFKVKLVAPSSFSSGNEQSITIRYTARAA